MRPINSVPLVYNLREGCGTRAHEDLSDTIIELLNAFIGHPKERLRGSFLGLFVCEVPHGALKRVLLSAHRSHLVIPVSANDKREERSGTHTIQSLPFVAQSRRYHQGRRA